MLWSGDWTGGRVHPWGVDTAPIRKLWWLAGDGTVNQPPCCCPGECSRRVCSRWLREIDICELQGYWSAALALRDDRGVRPYSLSVHVFSCVHWQLEHLC